MTMTTETAARPAGSPVLQQTHYSILRGGRAHVELRVVEYGRFKKKKRWCVWWTRSGPACRGWATLGRWFLTSEAALARAQRRWPGRLVEQKPKKPAKVQDDEAEA